MAQQCVERPGKSNEVWRRPEGLGGGGQSRKSIKHCLPQRGHNEEHNAFSLKPQGTWLYSYQIWLQQDPLRIRCKKPKQEQGKGVGTALLQAGSWKT